MNEILLVASLVLAYGVVLLAYKLFGKIGLFVANVFFGILANIEVTMLIDAFGMEQTLGNVLFAASFLMTDILSECEGRKCAKVAVWLGLFGSAFYMVLSQMWLLYTPSVNSFTGDAFQTIFASTPRILLASLVVYAISQIFDVWLYHKVWALTEAKCGNRRSFLWLRNTGSTLVSQFINAALFNIFAFWGMYDTPTMISIILSTYLIYAIASVLDTPIAYLARKMKENNSCGILTRDM